MSKFLDEWGLSHVWSKIKQYISDRALTAGKGVTIQNNSVSVDLPTVYLTQEEYDALTDEQKNENVIYATPGSGGNSSSSSAVDVYSTEETRIGTWIDGKPLYRKVFQSKTPSTTSSLGTIAIINDLSIVISIEGFFIVESGETRPLNLSNTAITHQISSTSVGMSVGVSTYVDRPLYAILKYTKTTD